MSQDPRADYPGYGGPGQRPPQYNPSPQTGGPQGYYNYGPQGDVLQAIEGPSSLKDDLLRLPKAYWRVLTRPGTQAFTQEAARGQWDIVWVQLLIYAIVTGAIYYVNLRLSGGLASLNTQGAGTISLPPTAQHVIEVAASLAIIAFIPLAFFIWQSVVLICARMFGGQGHFVQQSYAFLLFWVPLGIISGLLGLVLSFLDTVPFLIIAAIFACYQLVLSFFALKAVHRLNTGRAISAILAPSFILLLFAACALGALGALSGLAAYGG